MLQMPLWKRVLVIGICLIGIVVALPNLFYARVERANDARAAIAAGDEHARARGEAARWPGFLPSGLVNLGLDLRGGAHVLVEVDRGEVYAERLEQFWPRVRDALRDQRATVGVGPRGSTARPTSCGCGSARPAGSRRPPRRCGRLSQPVMSLTGGGEPRLRGAGRGGHAGRHPLASAEQAAMDERTMQQSLEIIRRRVDETGTREPSIQRQGADRILVQVPGVGSAEELLAIIGKTARLTLPPGGQPHHRRRRRRRGPTT